MVGWCAMPFLVSENISSFLHAGTKKACEREIEVLVYEQPNHCITLDRFMLAYEKKYSHKLSHFHGHPKLLKLLEDFPDTLEVRLSVCSSLDNARAFVRREGGEGGLC